MKTDQKRLFVAIPLPQLVRDELARIQEKLKQSSLCEGRYTNAAQAHLTLVFIGSVTASEVDPIKCALQTVSFPMLTAELGSVDVFQKHEEIRIIYLNIICHELATLANVVADTLRPWAQKEERPFVSHATIIRVKKVLDAEKLISLIQNISVEPHSFSIDSFVLMESELGPRGPNYRELIRYHLLDSQP
jgi:2'-5' RNA ligase